MPFRSALHCSEIESVEEVAELRRDEIGMLPLIGKGMPAMIANTHSEAVRNGTVHSMVEAELAAAEACAVVLRRFEGQPAAKELRRIQQEHREAANELRMHENEGRTSRAEPAWKKVARTISSLAYRLSNTAALRSLCRAEDQCFRLYKDAVFEKEVPVECQALIWSTLLPRLEAHRSSLDRLNGVT